jgi:hypothetical protein
MKRKQIIPLEEKLKNSKPQLKQSKSMISLRRTHRRIESA